MTLQQPTTFPVLNETLHKAAELTVSNAGFAAIFELHLGDTCIGYANCAPLSAIAYLICDLRIGSEHDAPLRRWLPAFLRPSRYRHPSWQTLLLEYIIREARQRGYKKLYADVTPTDDAANGDLLGWYGRHGFVPSTMPAARPHWKRLVRRL